jgi:hypothetical protein
MRSSVSSSRKLQFHGLFKLRFSSRIKGLFEINYLFLLVAPRFDYFFSCPSKLFFLKPKEEDEKKTNFFSIFTAHLHFPFSLPTLSSDRDNYIKVNWSNIKDKAVFNFKQFVAHVSMFETPYDYGYGRMH